MNAFRSGAGSPREARPNVPPSGFGRHVRETLRRSLPFAGAAAAVLTAGAATAYLLVLGIPGARDLVLPEWAQAAVLREGGGPQPHLRGLGPELSGWLFVNNVRVAVLVFLVGAAWGVGTLALLAVNGVAIGAMGGAYASLGVGGPFWLQLMPHGFLEITAICLAGAAGLRMGWGLLRPGARTRPRALAEEAAAGAVLLLVAVPAFGLAALIEGFVTPSGLPAATKVGVGLLALAAFLAPAARRPS